MAKADLHIHTRVSDGLASVAQTLEYIEHETDLDVVAITDHEDVRGGLEARDLAARRGYRVQVIPGAEVTTLQGHLVCLFIEETPRSFRPVERTIADVHRQGGLAIAAHPDSWLTRSISVRTIDRLVDAADPEVALDAIETANPSPAGMSANRRVLHRNGTRWRLPGVGASDAHHLPHIGTGWTEFPGTSAEDLKNAILRREVCSQMRPYPSWRTVGPRQIALGLAWGYSATPRKMLGPLFGSRGSRT